MENYFITKKKKITQLFVLESLFLPQNSFPTEENKYVVQAFNTIGMCNVDTYILIFELILFPLFHFLSEFSLLLNWGSL